MPLNRLKQRGPITDQFACHHKTNENVWHYALSNDKPDIIRHLLNTEDVSLIMSNQEIQRSGIHGKRNALHILIEKNDTKAAEQMLELVWKKIVTKENKLNMMKTEIAVDIDGQRPRRLSCLHFAAYHGRESLVELFLDADMDVDHLNDKEDTALLWAARQGHNNVVTTLLDRGANVEVRNDKGSTALHWAVRYEHTDTVRLLLVKGKANRNTKRKLGLVAPLVVAAAYGNNNIVELLLSDPKDPNDPKCKVNIKIHGGELPIHHAAKEGHMKVLETLQEHGALLDENDELGDTPLLLAAQNNHVDVVQKLISLGADVFHRNHEGNDIWNYAINRADNDLLEALIKSCLDSGIDRTAGHPFFIAAASGRIDKIRFLLEVEDDPLATDKDGNTFLHYAAMNNEYELIKTFHEKIPIDLKNKRGDTALHIACSKGFEATIKTLLICKASTDVKNNRNETPLHLAAYSKRITADAVRELIEKTTDAHAWESLNATDDKGKNCLHVAGKFARPDVMWEFRSARLKDRDKDGNTPLHKAVRPGQPKALRKLYIHRITLVLYFSIKCIKVLVFSIFSVVHSLGLDIL